MLSREERNKQEIKEMSKDDKPNYFLVSVIIITFLLICICGIFLL